VLDGAGYHRSSVVVEKAKELNIKLHYLPPYSPNLNPIADQKNDLFDVEIP
jgi:transposase